MIFQFLIPLLVFCSPQPWQDSKYADFVRVVREMREDGSLKVYDSKIYERSEGIQYTLAPIFSNYRSKHMSAFLVVCSRQLKLDALKSYVDVDKLNRGKEEVARCEALIIQQVAVLAKGKDLSFGGDAYTKIIELDKDAKGALEAAIGKIYGNAKVKEGSLAGAGGHYKVIFELNPGNGRVYFLTACEYRLANVAGVLSNHTAWNEVGGSSISLGGNFYFLVKWSDGKEKKSGKINISNDLIMKFVPD